MNRSKFMLLAALSAWVIQSCTSTSTDKKVDKELSQEAPLQSSNDLRTELGQVIKSAPGLTDVQRSKLTELQVSTRAKIDEIRAESLKLRSVLIKNLITSKYSPDEVASVEKKIRENNDKRLTVTFNAVEQANVILGHETLADRQRIIDTFMLEHEGHGA